MDGEEKRMAGAYEIIQSFYIGDREIVLGENQGSPDSLPYMTAYCENYAFWGRYYEIMASDDFSEIAALYGQRIMEQAEKTRIELKKPKIQGIDTTPIHAEDCTPICHEDSLKGKIIVIRPEVLRLEYRQSTHQLKLCTGGFGASPHSRGSAVYCTDLYSGENSRYERRDVLGTLAPEHLPEWARHGLTSIEQAEKRRKAELAKEGR